MTSATGHDSHHLVGHYHETETILLIYKGKRQRILRCMGLFLYVSIIYAEGNTFCDCGSLDNKAIPTLNGKNLLHDEQNSLL